MDSGKSIAFISEHASPMALLGGEDAGGQNVYVDELSRQLARLGYRIDIFTRRDNADTPEVVQWAPGVRIVHLLAGPPLPILKDQMWEYMPEMRDSFLRFVQREHVHYSLIHSHFWMSGWVATELQRRLDIPTVHIFHALGSTKRRFQGANDTSPRERIEVEKGIVRDVDTLIAQCPAEQQELIDDYQADPHKIALIPAAVNTSMFRPVSRIEARYYADVAEDDFVIVYVGRMLPRKDVRNVVEGVAALIRLCEEQMPAMVAKIKLLLVGGETPEPDPLRTPELGVLQHLACGLGIEQHVRIVGKRQQDMLRYYYGAGDVAVTTPWYEPFGLTPLEAMACARPVIGSAVGGIAYTLEDGKTGFHVEPRNPAMLAHKLCLFMQEPALTRKMGYAAHKRVERDFTWSITAERIAQVYQQLAIGTPWLHEALVASLPNSTGKPNSMAGGV